MLYSSPLTNKLLNDPNLKEEADGMNIENELFKFYTKEEEEEKVYSDQEALEMIEEATININKHFVTIYWEETGAMDIFKKTEETLVHLASTFFLERGL